MKKFLLILFLFPCFLSAQNTDSLKLALKNAKHDSTRCNVLMELCDKASPDELKNYSEQLKTLAEKNLSEDPSKPIQKIYLRSLAFAFSKMGVIHAMRSDFTKALEYWFKGLSVAEVAGDKIQVRNALGNIAKVYYHQADYPKALEYYFKSLKLSEEMGDKQTEGRTLANIATAYNEQADFPKALEYYLKGLKLSEEAGDKRQLGNTLGNIANMYRDQSDYPKALDYHFKSLKMSEEVGNKSAIGRTLGNIANVYYSQRDYPKALEYNFKSLKMAEEIGDKQQMGTTLGNMGSVYQDQSDYLKALDCLRKGLVITEEAGDKLQVGYTLGSIGNLYTIIGKYKESELNLKKALTISKEIGAEFLEKNTHEFLSSLYDKTKQPALALDHYKKFISLRDTIYSHENSKKLMRSEMDHEYQKQEAVANAVHKKELENQQFIADEKNRKQKIISMSVGGGLFLVLVFAGFIFRSLRVTRKQKQLIEEQKKAVEEQKELVDEKQKEILDSIHYAKRIQTALITSEKYIDKNLNKLNKD